jgi:multidrug efflux pump subunit AcrB
MRRLDPGARRGVVHWAITHPIGTTIVSLAICVLGASMVSRLAVDLLPRIVYPEVMARVTNPEVDPEVMEQTVAKVLEPRMATTEDAILITSWSEEGRTAVELHFWYRTDVDVALRDASTKLDQAPWRTARGGRPAHHRQVRSVADSGPPVRRSLADSRPGLDQALVRG